MNRAFLPFVKSLLVSMIAVSALAHAQGKPAPKVDPAKGETLYTNGDAARNIPACVSCHGAAGASTIVQNPKLGGQHEAYIYKQMVDFKGDARNNPIMSPIAKALTDEEMKNLAAWLDKQTPKPGAARNNDSLELGKKIFRAGIAAKDVPACASCHGATGAGIPAQFARLGGQHQDYTLAQLVAFSNGTRKNSPQMTTIAKRLSEDEMKAVADYMAGLK